MEIKTRRPSYSTRSWINKLGVKNSGTLSRIMTGKRPLPQSVVNIISEQNSFTTSEKAYLEFMACCYNKISPESFEYIREVLRKNESDLKI